MFREIEEHGDLTNLGVFDVYPPASDRPAWELVPASYRRTLVKEGERWLGYEYPPVYASDYMEFCRTGNRSRFEEKQFHRRIVLNALVMAECAARRRHGSFRPTIRTSGMLPSTFFPMSQDL